MRSLRWIAMPTLLLIWCCASTDQPQSISTRTGPQVTVKTEEFLYTRLGGLEAIKAVVDDFVNRVAADQRINHFFAQAIKDPAEIADFKKKLVDQICQVTGGPCVYKGKDMKKAHAGMGVSGADFDALVGDLGASLDALHVNAKDKNELLGTLAPLKDEIVEPKAP
jgi:hemoglobin